MKKYLALTATHGYFLMTILGFLTMYSFKFHSQELVFLFGCHSATVYPFYGALLIAGLTNSKILAIICLIAWGIYVVSLIVSYILASFKRIFAPLSYVALIDTLFSALMALHCICSSVRDLRGGVSMLIGVLTSFLTYVCLKSENHFWFRFKNLIHS